MKIRLYNTRILTMEENKPIFRGEVWIKDEVIVRILPQGCPQSSIFSDDESLIKSSDKPQIISGTEFQSISDDEFPIIWDEEIDCQGNLLMPGFKNAHTHSAMTCLRSFADDVPLNTWLTEKIFPIEAKLQPNDIYTLTKLAILEYLSSGITAIFDMYLCTEAVAKACQDTGMRCVLTGGLHDHHSSIAQVEEEYNRFNTKGSLISYELGFHAEYTCQESLLRQVAHLAKKYEAPVYTHLAETASEVAGCQSRHGMTPAVYLDSLGVFAYGGGGFHCVHMTDADIEVFKRRHLYAITNPASNAKLASGIAPLARFVKESIPVAIGTDGPASNNCLDMFREMFLAVGLSHLREQDAASLEATKVLSMATVGGARAMRLLRSDTIAAGKFADLILLDLQQPNMQPIHHLQSNIVYSGSKSNVALTMIHGKILYRNGKYHISEEVSDIYKACDQIVGRIL